MKFKTKCKQGGCIEEIAAIERQDIENLAFLIEELAPSRTDCPPSIRHKVASHLREKKFIESILPVSRWIVETANFDIHKLTNPSIEGIGYQKGAQLGFYNTKAYVLSRDKYTCQKCRRKNLTLHVHHILFKSDNGTDAPDNLITLCKACHEKVHSLKNEKKVSKSLQQKTQKHTKHASEVSILRSYLRKSFGDFEETFGHVTKFHRESFNLPKTHLFDAMSIACQGKKCKPAHQYFLKRLISKGDYRQRKGIRSEKAIPTGKLFGLRKFDLVKAKKFIGFIKGKRSSGYFSLGDMFGKTLHNSFNIKKAVKRLAARKLVLTRMGTVDKSFYKKPSPFLPPLKGEALPEIVR